MAVDSIIDAVTTTVDRNLMVPTITQVWGIVCPQPNEGFPYMVVRWPSTKFQWTFETVHIEKPVLILEIYHTVFGPAEAAMRRIIKSIRDVGLPNLVDQSLQLFPVNLYGADEPLMASGSNVVYRVVCECEIWIGRSS